MFIVCGRQPVQKLGCRGVQRMWPVLKELTAKAGGTWSLLLSDHLSSLMCAPSHFSICPSVYGSFLALSVTSLKAIFHHFCIPGSWFQQQTWVGLISVCRMSHWRFLEDTEAWRELERTKDCRRHSRTVLRKLLLGRQGPIMTFTGLSLRDFHEPLFPCNSFKIFIF